MGIKAVAKFAPVYVQYTAGVAAEVLDQAIFVADRDYEVIEVSEVHSAAGSDVGAVTLDVKKASSGTAIAAGTSVLGSTFDLKSTAATPVRKTTASGLSTSVEGTRVNAGQALGVDITGTTTAVAGVCVTVVLQPIKG